MVSRSIPEAEYSITNHPQIQVRRTVTVPHHAPKRERYSADCKNAFTISASIKLPPNSLSLLQQQLYPFMLKSGESLGFRRKYPKYCIKTNARLNLVSGN